ncbi:DUF2207 domain-containing protein [Rhizobium sp. TRM95111]|uniref:DUF2207 domain-containing protein n=1 Tax=Rhizobium alarense TaxID=2846851 RepID=UPI001F2BB173|nr:DUF2207 domain-containing protein [Rhizobium alarense]MCF3642890.1 DUF2207 domain-containing protein [Rhizobium alarense]
MLRVLLLIVTLVSLSGVPAAAEEAIERFDSAIAVAKNGTLTVTETIEVTAEGRDIRRGIYRDFPLTFVDADGRQKEVGFDIVSVRRDGAGEDYHTERISGGIRIYFGSADRLLEPGRHVYELTYETTRQIRVFESHDELYWNVTGTEWMFPIRRASAAVTLPEGVEAQEIAWFTGAFGATGRDARGSADGNRATFETTRELAPREGLTIAVKMPPGSIDRPTAGEQRLFFLKDNRNLLLALAGFALVLVYYARAWLLVGRDPARGVVVPRWDAPDGASPALVNYIDGRGFAGQGWTAFSAALLSLAVKGHVTLEDLKAAIVVKRTDKRQDGTLPAGEAAILKDLGAPGSSFTIDKANGKRVQSLGGSFRSAIEKEHRNKYYLANWPYVIGGIALSVVCLAALVIFGSLSDNEIALIVMPVFAAVFVSIFAVVLGQNFRQARSLGARILAVLMIAFVSFVMLSVLGGMLIAVLATGTTSDELPLFAAVGGIMLLNVLFFFLMGAPTPLGRRMMDGIEGLRQYLTLAEKDRMNLAGVPEMSPGHFETLLPYAVALGVEKPWSETFERWLAAAVAAGAASAYAPYWYGGSRLHSGSFADRMGGFAGSMADTITASLPPPPKSSSSGFSSGGGSSGGGGGGGGGGGW